MSSAPHTRRSRASDDAAAAAIKRQRAGRSAALRSLSPPSVSSAASSASAAAATTPSGESAAQVFAVELLTQKILTILDAPSVVQFAAFLRSCEAWRHVLSDEKLWRELVTAHFGGPVPVHMPAATPEQLAAYRGDDNFSDDDGDDESEDEDDDNEESNSDSETDARGRRRGAAQAATTTQTPAPPLPTAPKDPTTPVRQLSMPRFACQSLMHFARSSRQRAHFRDAVHVLSGDIGTIVTVNGTRVDGIAFASSGYLHNPHTGVANVVFQRAGRGLDNYIDAAGARIDVGEVFVSPGFDAGVDKLIHCVGPIYLGGRGVPLLAQTYDSALQAAAREQLRCVAMTSISTGNLGFPLREAAATGLRAIQRFLREHAWSGTLAVVCYEPDVFDEFSRQRQCILDAFNAA